MTVQQIALLVTPFALLASTRIAFRLFGRMLGPRWGYLCGFLSYWAIWCLALPWWVLGKQGIQALLVEGLSSLRSARMVGHNNVGDTAAFGLRIRVPSRRSRRGRHASPRVSGAGGCQRHPRGVALAWILHRDISRLVAARDRVPVRRIWHLAPVSAGTSSQSCARGKAIIRRSVGCDRADVGMGGVRLGLNPHDIDCSRAV